MMSEPRTNKLFGELQRLYFPEQSADSPAGGGNSALTPERLARSLAGKASALVSPADSAGRVRCLRLLLNRPGAWNTVQEICRVVEEELAWPAPAISVSATDGYCLWFALAEPVSPARGAAFLEALRRRSLDGQPAAGIRLQPAPDDAVPAGIELVPALDAATGKWSAYIDPSLGAMFADDPGLDMLPSPDRQADLLGGVALVKPGEFEQALASLGVAVSGETRPGTGNAAPSGTLGQDAHYADPRSFLLAVMNDAAVALELRIEAAKALLPYPSGQDAK
jgi:hypothetical protein